MQSCDICSEHDHAHNSRITTARHNFQSSYSFSDSNRIRPFVRDYETDNFLTRTTLPSGIQLHECSFTCTFPVVHRTHFYCFTYKGMLKYAYYQNLTSSDKILHQKCHTRHNDLYYDVFQILKKKFVNVYSIFHIWLSVMKKHSVQELHMIRDSVITVALDLKIDFQANPGLIDHKLPFPTISYTNQIKYSNSFLQ